MRSPLIIVALLCLLLCGCEEELATRYGVRAATADGHSVNGTAVLANMFEQAGHKVHVRTALTPTVAERAGTIVWFPDTFAPPSPQEIRWLEDWLDADPDHLLIYVGRDYDAAPAYWEAVIPGAPANESAELSRRLSDARGLADLKRSTATNADCSWFRADYRASASRRLSTLSGPWADGIDPKQANINIRGKLKPRRNQRAETLLESGGDPLVWRMQPTRGGGHVIVVSNGSFLLNYPLINHEHRKLAARLVAEAAPDSRVVFLESGQDGLPIRSDEPAHEIPSLSKMFTVWPINVLLLHLVALGVALCVCWWPIFGRPKSARREAVSDFARHVDALGEMLEATRDAGYATIRVLQYQQVLRGEAVPPSALRGVPPSPPEQKT